MFLPFFKSGERKKIKERSEQNKLKAAGSSSNPQLSIKLAEHFLHENKRELAVEEYVHAAQAFLEKRQLQLAMAVYRNVIGLAPDRYEAYVTLAELYRMVGYPGDCASVLLALAEQYQRADRRHDVSRVLNMVLDLDPGNPVIQRKVGTFYERQKSAAPPESVPAPAGPAAASFFDLESALHNDASLSIDSPGFAGGEGGALPDGSPHSILNIVKNIAVQDPRQDTPGFHFNLGIAYMQCGEYEQAVDELLSSLYGCEDKLTCYLRLAECSLVLQRKEVACGFLKEARDLKTTTASQAQAIEERLRELTCD